MVHAIEVHDHVRGMASQVLSILQKALLSVNDLSQVLNTIDPKLLREVESFIEDVVDFEASSMEARFIVKRGVDEEVHIELM